MSNEPLFNKIKSELDNYQPAYDPADWEKMAQMLDKKKRIVPMGALRAAAGVAILIGLGTAAYFGFLKPDRDMATNQFATTTFDLDFSMETFKNSVAKSSEAAENKKQTTGNDELLADNQSSSIEKSNNHQEITNTGNVKDSEKSSNNDIVKTEKTGNTPYATSDEKSKQTAANDQKEPPFPNKLSMARFPGSGEEAALQSNPSLNEIFGSQQDKEHHKNQKLKWWAGAAIKPSVQVVSNSKGTFGQGLVAGVDFANNVGIETGLFYEQMKYEESPETGLRLDVNHVSTQGNYSGISIPVKFNYRFNKGRALQPTVHAGLTAFMPTKEEYVFSYGQTNSIGSSGNPHYLSSSATMNDTLTINRTPAGRQAESADALTYSANNYESIQGDSKDIYMMASAGGGLRYYFNSRLSFQISANYVQPLSEIGIEGRKIRQFDFGLAMQYQIN